jgi:hypothetical protein
MSKVSLRLPGSLHQRARILASQDGVSINHFITLALAEKVAVLENAGYLQERGTRSDIDAALAVLDKAADQKPSAQDRINP